MKNKWLVLLLTLPTLLIGYDDFEAEFDVPAKPPPYLPLSLSGSYLQVSRARFTSPNYVAGEKLIYKQFDSAVAYTHELNDTYGLIFGGAWVGTVVNWKQNPAFTETDFNYINLSLGGYASWFNCFTLIGTFGIFIDTAHFSLIDYTLYQPLLQAKYTIFEHFELDLGVIAEAGLDRLEMWPIAGFNYVPQDTNWRIHAVYPINMDFEFDVNPCTTVATGLRFLRNRHRVGDSNPLPQSIFQYKSWGFEFDLNYHPYDFCSFRGAIGTTLFGSLRIANRVNEDPNYYKFENTLYGAINAVLGF